MAMNDVIVVLAHGGWADGSSWARVITGLAAHGIKAVAAPLPLTELAETSARRDIAVRALISSHREFSLRSTEQIGTRYQPQDRQGARPYLAAITPRPRQRRDRIIFPI